MLKQRNNYDCGICCLAMAFGVSYEQMRDRAGVVDSRGLSDETEERIIRSFGYGFRSFYKWWYEKNGGNFWRELKNKRALISLPSLNLEGEYHLVYWDGKNLLDPSNLKTYTIATVPAAAHARVLVPPIGG